MRIHAAKTLLITQRGVPSAAPVAQNIIVGDRKGELRLQCPLMLEKIFFKNYETTHTQTCSEGEEPPQSK